MCRILDNLPVAIPQIRDDGGTTSKRYERGFTVGRLEVQKPTVSCSMQFVDLDPFAYGHQDSAIV